MENILRVQKSAVIRVKDHTSDSLILQKSNTDEADEKRKMRSFINVRDDIVLSDRQAT